MIVPEPASSIAACVYRLAAGSGFWASIWTTVGLTTLTTLLEQAAELLDLGGVVGERIVLLVALLGAGRGIRGQLGGRRLGQRDDANSAAAQASKLKWAGN